MKTINLFLSLFWVLCLFGCGSNELDKDTASKVIIAKENLPKIYDYEVYYQDMTDAKRLLDAGLDRDGLVRIMKTQSTSQLGMDWITFTGAAKPYLLNQSDKEKASAVQRVKVADLDLGGITGIVMAKDGKAAMVTYNLIYKNISPFAKLINHKWDKPEAHKVYLVRYNTGWKIDPDGALLFIGD